MSEDQILKTVNRVNVHYYPDGVSQVIARGKSGGCQEQNFKTKTKFIVTGVHNNIKVGRIFVIMTILIYDLR